MIYIYRKQSSTGARQLSIAVGGTRMFRPENHTLRAGDAIVCWGARMAPRDGINILNGGELRTKYEDAIKLKEENVPTITVSLQAGAAYDPRVRVVDPRVEAFNLVREGAGVLRDRQWDETRLYRDLLKEHRENIVKFEAAIAAGAPVLPAPRIWLPRSNSHVGGNDLITAPRQPDYYSLKLDIVKEYRVHSFKGRSLRAGVKRIRDGFTAATASPWIRSWDGGWQISYDGHSSTEAHRKLAHKAVKALGLDFGAVDIAELADGKLIVLEVNRAPGLEGNTVVNYADAIREWAGQQVGRNRPQARRAA